MAPHAQLLQMRNEPMMLNDDDGRRDGATTTTTTTTKRLSLLQNRKTTKQPNHLETAALKLVVECSC
eukprot:475260-Pyramimonas_sp.AAC.1